MAAVSGPLAPVRDCDVVELDVPAPRLDFCEDQEELQRRCRTLGAPASAGTYEATAAYTITMSSRPTSAATSISSAKPTSNPNPRTSPMAGWGAGSRSMSILYRSDEPRGAAWARHFVEHAPDLDFRVWPDAGELNKVEYLIAWQTPADFIAKLPRLKVLFSSGAGIDHIDLSAVPTHIPIVRMVEPGIINGMVEYVSMAVLALHRDLFDYVEAKTARLWAPIEVVPASSRTIGVMGMGILGRAVLERLASYGFGLRGWNRSLQQMAGVETFGADQLQHFLDGCDVLVCLLPLTRQTKGILNQKVFSTLPAGASLINVGRGPLLNDADLLEALNSGRLSRAILDVTEPEPLPSEHPFWTHPRIFMTPHIASMTQPETAAPIVLQNIRRHQRGEPLTDVIDRSRGY